MLVHRVSGSIGHGLLTVGRSFREAFIRWVGDGSMLLFGVAGT
jgi:hypothetical protein